jgi:protein tyrosine phosphatase
LNASLIPPYPYEGLGKRRSYISSQAPLPQTLPVFYDNVIKHNVSLIVNLTPLVEHGRVKSDEYWPTDKNQRWTSTPGYRIEHRQDPSPIEGGRSATTASFKADHYQLRLHDEGEIKQQHDFDLIHMTSWPDFGAFSSDIMIHLLELIERTAKGSDPVWVHCSAGIGRSGTLIASLLARDLKSSLSQALQLEPITAPSMLAMEALKAARRLVDHERRYRPKMVQTPEQLGMVASVIGSFLQEDVTV